MADGVSNPDFHLPNEILSVIPTDPYEQLNLARKITSLAIASRVSKLESEAVRSNQKISDKDRAISDLESRISELENMLREADARLRTVLEDNIKLSKERDSLILTSKKTSRDLAKMEAFKRQLMQSLNDDSISTETVDIVTCDQPILSKPAARKGKISSTSYIAPRITPGTTPKITSTVSSPKQLPKSTSGALSPLNSHAEGSTSISPWCPSSKLNSAASSPPRGRTRVDGKEFFRLAKNRLSYEQFAAFLANVKELNSRRQSREETLKKAEDIFGAENKDLYLSFQGLLNRNMP